jgi:hypothetical protein
MSRRADPERIYQAQRAGTFRRLVLEGRLDELDAEHWVSAWEREAPAIDMARGSDGYWADGWVWIKQQRSGPQDDQTKRDMSADGDDGQVYGG